MLILSIETSCDETAAAVVDGDQVLSSVVWSQIKYHREWGGVVPTIARRAHEERLPAVVETAIRRAKAHWNETCATRAPCGTRDTCIDAIAVTIGPGLAPALEAGIAFAKKLADEKNLPLIAVSHLEGHIASLFLKRKSGSPYSSNFPNHPNFPNSFLSLIVSGGHTELVETTRIPNGELQMTNENADIQHSSFNIHHTLLGQTLDDAAGECIDKVGRELGLGYPAGAAMEQLAKSGNPKKVLFPIPLLRSTREDLNFSFSGLKTAAVQMLQGTHNIKRASQRNMRELAKQEMCDFCASFQEAIIDALLLKLKRAIEITGIKTIFLSGGVAANNRLRRQAGVLVRSLGGRLYATPKQFSGDNAAMIGLAAQWGWARGEAKRTRQNIASVDRLPNLNFS